MPVEFDLHNGFTPNLTGQIRPASISMDLHPVQLVKFNWHLKPLTGGTQYNLNGFPPNSTDSTRHHLNEK